MDGLAARLDANRATTCAIAVSVGAATALALWQLSRALTSVVHASVFEAERLVEEVTSAAEGQEPPFVPPELDLWDDVEEIWTYGSTQELFYRRGGPGGRTEWQYSWDAHQWWPTDVLLPASVPYLLDPPSVIFITRLHLMGLARRLARGAAGRGRSSDTGGASASGKQQPCRIPPPVTLPAWASAQLEQQQLALRMPPVIARLLSRGGGAGPARRAGGGDVSGSGRRLEDAPESLCCPITGQLMLQPVTLPSGAAYDYPALRRWLTQHGSDPTTLAPAGLDDVRPCLLARALVERWLAGETDVLGCGSGRSGG